MIEAIFFDVGGVLFDEGFRKGLHDIALRNGLDIERFELISNRLILETGYLTGKASEEKFWDAVRAEFCIDESDAQMRLTLLERFTPRHWIMDLVKSLRNKVKLGILSDQTNWLDIMNESYGFFRMFDVVLNSYHTGRSKIDRTTFDYAASIIGARPDKILFIDDRAGNIRRAQQSGFRTILFRDKEQFLKEFEDLGFQMTGQPLLP